MSDVETLKARLAQLEQEQATLQTERDAMQRRAEAAEEDWRAAEAAVEQLVGDLRAVQEDYSDASAALGEIRQALQQLYLAARQTLSARGSDGGAARGFGTAGSVKGRHDRQRRRGISGMGEPLSKRKRRWKLEMAHAQRYRCVYCGNRFALDELTFEHVKPLKDGGTWGRYNLVLACAFCNNARNATFMAEKRRIQASGLTVAQYHRERHQRWLDSQAGRERLAALLRAGRMEAALKLLHRFGCRGELSGAVVGSAPAEILAVDPAEGIVAPGATRDA